MLIQSQKRQIKTKISAPPTEYPSSLQLAMTAESYLRFMRVWTPKLCCCLSFWKVDGSCDWEDDQMQEDKTREPMSYGSIYFIQALTLKMEAALHSKQSNLWMMSWITSKMMNRMLTTTKTQGVY